MIIVKVLYAYIPILQREKKIIAMLTIAIAFNTYTQAIIAQNNPIPPNLAIPNDLAPKVAPQPPTEPAKLPSPEQLFSPQNPKAPLEPQIPSNSTTELIVVKKFEIIGSSAFSNRN